MVYIHRKPSVRTRKAMASESVKIGQTYLGFRQSNIYSQLKNYLSNYLNKGFIEITSCANGAILAAMTLSKKGIFIPDMGGWYSYKTFPSLLCKKTIEIETTYGIIDPGILKGYIKKYPMDMIILSSLAGYMAYQPMKAIRELCEDSGILIVEDISGVIGSSYPGEFADIVVGSTGSMKIANTISGGFIATDDPDIFSKLKNPLTASKCNPVTMAGMLEEIKLAKNIYPTIKKLCSDLKNSLDIDAIVHPNEEGIIIGFELKKDKISPEKVAHTARKLNMITDLNSPLIMTGPRYDRLNLPSFTVELKKIDISEYIYTELRDRLFVDITDLWKNIL